MDKQEKVEVFIRVKRMSDGVSAEAVVPQSWMCSFPPQRILEDIVDAVERIE